MKVFQSMVTDFLLNAYHLHYMSSAYKVISYSGLDIVDFAAHFSIHAIKIGFQKYYIYPGKCCP